MKKLNIDDIKVSSQLDDFINNAIKEGYKDYDSKKTKNKKYRNTIVAAATIIIVIAAVNSEFVSASVEKIKNTIGDFAVDHKYSIPKEDKTVIGQTIEDKKIKVTLNECYVDDNMLMFTTNLDSRERFDYAQGIQPNIYVNGKLIDIYENNYGEDYIHNDDKTVSILSSISLDNIDTNQDLNITIDYNKIEVTNIFDSNKEVSGNWKYSFTINKSQINKQVITKEINQTIIIEDQELHIDNMKIFPYRIELTTNALQRMYRVHYILKDDKGNEYIDESGHGVNGIETSNYSLNTKDINSIAVIPRTDFHNDEPIMNYDKAVTINIR